MVPCRGKIVLPSAVDPRGNLYEKRNSGTRKHRYSSFHWFLKLIVTQEETVPLGTLL